MTNKLAAVTVLALLLVAPSFGQTFGAISGLVTDSSGSIIAGAKITITNPQTGFTRDTASNDAGNYSFPDLPPGIYDVKAESQGFTTEVRSAVELQVQQTARIDFQLKVGAVNETVEVQGGAPLVNSENATVGTVIEQQRIEDLPLNGRSFISLIALSPNVTSGQTSVGGYAQVRGGSARGEVSIAISGNRREYQYYTLDGISDTEVDFNTYAFLPSIDALQEFKIQTGVYSAEYGHEVSQVNVSTRSGTNSYHGTVFEFLRNNDLDARPLAFTSVVPAVAPFKWNQYGYTLGGPVQIPKIFNGKNRLFFMSNYEGFRLNNQTQQVFSTAPSALRTGNFSSILPGTVIADPLNNNAPFPGNIIPSTRLSPISLGLLQFWPTPNIPGSGLANNYLALQNDENDKAQFTERLDFVEGSKSSWFGRYSWQNEYLLSPYLYEDGTTVSDRVRQAMISNTRILSPTLVNDFSFGWLAYHNILLGQLAYIQDPIKGLDIPIVDPPPVAWGAPNIDIEGYAISSSAGYFGNNLQGPFATNNDTFQWRDGISWTHGSHTIKFGAEVRRDRYNDVGNQSPDGQFQFTNQATGYGLSDYLLGYIDVSSQAGALAYIELRNTSQAYYVTDNWKVRPNLTIEAGLRYEFTPPWNSRNDTMVNTVVPVNENIFAPPLPSNFPQPYMERDCAAYGQNSFYPPNDLIRFPTNVPTECVTGAYTTFVHPDYLDFAPRLGIAWSPDKRWTIRLGGGIFYTSDSQNSYLDMGRTLAGKISITTNTETHNLTWENPFGQTTSSNACGTSAPYFCLAEPGVNATDPNLRNAYVVQQELNIQRQLTDNTVLEVGYLGEQGHRLLARVQFDDSAEGPNYLAGSADSREPWPEYANIQTYGGWGKSNYNAASVKLTRRLAQGLTFLAGYTFSKSLDDQSAVNPANGNAPRAPQNGWCIICEYGPSDYDTRHRLVTSVLYVLPVGKGQRFLNSGIGSAVLGGWSLNSINTISTGFPLTVIDGINRSNSNQSNDRPDVVPGVPVQLANPTTGEWFNTAAFVLEPAGYYGNLGRNTVTSPGFVSWDFSVLKNFNFAESRYVQFRFECFNCANHPALGDPNTTLTSAAFGTITSTRTGIDMRELQFSLKLIF
jgi:Carboxypeptidase regulatory-like domain